MIAFNIDSLPRKYKAMVARIEFCESDSTVQVTLDDGFILDKGESQIFYADNRRDFVNILKTRITRKKKPLSCAFGYNKTITHPFIKKRFIVDGIPGSYEGYTNGADWNGWECPFFTLKQAKKLMNECNRTWKCEGMIDRLRYDKDKDAFFYDVLYYGDAIEETRIEAVYLGDVVVYGIGTGCWTWMLEANQKGE